jgi:uncharacterized protein YcbX
MVTLAGLHVYPVKSCRGHAALCGFDLAGDRRLLVIDERGPSQPAPAPTDAQESALSQNAKPHRHPLPDRIGDLSGRNVCLSDARG